jgi:hypothetical protein
VGATGTAGTSITLQDTSDNNDYYITMAAAFAGTVSTLYVDNPGFRFNPSTGTLTANVFTGQSNTARYADLAEYYLSDSLYQPGTVVSFGGSLEITVSDRDQDPAVAGVISANPAYAMNSALEGENVLAVALQGRVPCFVVGSVRKGDLMVSAGNGHARSQTAPAAGTIIGKALEDFDGDSGIIEVVVGRS